ncbi:MAG: flavin monoamine oxidase family protein [Gammaproteobacteria bacterium]
MLDIAIIGGGLSGLSLAQHLQAVNRFYAVFESRDRVGGRILSQPTSFSKQGSCTHDDPLFRHDLGAGWIWPDSQPRIAAFIRQHGIEIYPQWVMGKSLYQADRNAAPKAYEDGSTYGSARRIRGGTYRLAETLLERVPAEAVKLNHHLLSVIDADDHIELNFRHQNSTLTVKARQVVITVSPRLIVHTISFSPELAPRLQELMNDTPTWMAGHAKALIRYSRAFWREAGFSGNALASYRGAVLSETFDACSANGDFAALSGFIALPAGLRRKYRNDLNALILDQLARLFGKEAVQPNAILIQDWFEESLTATPVDEIPPPNHPQYGHRWFQLDHWNDKLFFSGTETARRFGGYLEGALEATERVANYLLL